MSEKTSRQIKVSASVWEALRNRKQYGMTFNDVIEQLIFDVERKEKKEKKQIMIDEGMMIDTKKFGLKPVHSVRLMIERGLLKAKDFPQLKRMPPDEDAETINI